MPSAPILADFAIRLALGLSIILAATSRRAVPASYFRTNCQVILGLLVLASLDVSRNEGASLGFWSLVAAAVAAYAGAIAWGLGLPRVGRPAVGLIALIAAAWLGSASADGDLGLWLFNAASRCSSGFVLGASLAAMLLGHHYLTAPAMSIEPLKRSVRFMGWGLGVRAALALVGLILSLGPYAGLSGSLTVSNSWLFPMMRWGMGLVAPGIAMVMVWKTVEIRSTQSATGILYAAVTLLLVGELSSLILARAGSPIT